VSDVRPRHPGLAMVHDALHAVMAADLPGGLADQVRDALDALTLFCSSPTSRPAPVSLDRAAESAQVQRVMREGGLPRDEVLAGSDFLAVRLHLWLLLRTEPIAEQEAEGFVVRAQNEREARRFVIAHEEMGDEGAAAWLNPERSRCTPLHHEGLPAVILASRRD
jgi:hypothetical protein